MVTRCFIRPQARVAGVVVKGVKVRCSATRRPLDRRRNTTSLSKPQLLQSTPTFTSTRPFPTKTAVRTASPVFQEDQALDVELGKATGVLRTDKVPEEQAVIEALRICENLARSITEPIEPTKAPPKSETGPTSNLLSMEEGWTPLKKAALPQASLTTPVTSGIVQKITKAAYQIVTDANVFITPQILATYVHTQAILGRPETFPEIFSLCASKPIPLTDTTPIKYKAANPKRLTSAIPLVVAQDALRAAIQSKKLALALSIIDTSVCTTAYKRNKVFRKALLPFTVFALTPPAAYVVAHQFAEYQTTMEPQMATNIVFAGIIAYVGFTATIGMVAITTANDQMNRVTWARGMGLRERWLREDERALVDRVACAWGFQDVHMWGEEESPEWEALRRWAGLRGMVLDAPELMEGME
ncbi:hypothetical protein JMJ35_008027 [Cladonia borealis]|uniref:Uncharacterized protein n=1 Tax=Cladonia borealis TaxID=184061 RepID=A0AA39QXN9_9LECA|nr:hypothetical protein JMJ35_008027 [Cladonia borealis]